jgi:hypothetical protein
MSPSRSGAGRQDRGVVGDRLMAKLLRAQYFVADVAVFPGIAMAWSARFGRQPHPFVCVQTPTLMPASGTAVIADFWISTLQ